ncbi:MAG: hypothetical protein ABIH85_00380, partial [Candidatus Omnitrophota bacterium]
FKNTDAFLISMTFLPVEFIIYNFGLFYHYVHINASRIRKSHIALDTEYHLLAVLSSYFYILSIAKKKETCSNSRLLLVYLIYPGFYNGS